MIDNMLEPDYVMRYPILAIYKLWKQEGVRCGEQSKQNTTNEVVRRAITN